jgi:hypothetical protein
VGSQSSSAAVTRLLSPPGRCGNPRRTCIVGEVAQDPGDVHMTSAGRPRRGGATEAHRARRYPRRVAIGRYQRSRCGGAPVSAPRPDRGRDTSEPAPSATSTAGGAYRRRTGAKARGCRRSGAVSALSPLRPALLLAGPPDL